MAELVAEDWPALVQAHVNCVELCKALSKQSKDPHVREASGRLIDDLQASLAALASHLRQQGVRPGAYDLDSHGKATIRAVLASRSLAEQLLAVHNSLADLATWYADSPRAEPADPSAPDWLESLSTQAQRFLADWERHLNEMKVTREG